MTDIKDIDYEIVWEPNDETHQRTARDNRGKYGIGEIHFDNGWGASVRTEFCEGEERCHDIAVIASRLNGIHFPKYAEGKDFLGFYEEELLSDSEANRLLEKIKNEPKCEL